MNNKKKIPCKFHYQGICKFGKNCIYSHNFQIINKNSISEFTPENSENDSIQNLEFFEEQNNFHSDSKIKEQNNFHSDSEFQEQNNFHPDFEKQNNFNPYFEKQNNFYSDFEEQNNFHSDSDSQDYGIYVDQGNGENLYIDEQTLALNMMSSDKEDRDYALLDRYAEKYM